MVDWTGSKPAGYSWFIDYYLDELRKADVAQGRRLVDVLDFHWYSEVAVGSNVYVNLVRNDPPETAETVRQRVQAPRSLWDPDFKENSWITAYDTIPGCPGCGIELLPRLRRHVDAHYPGTGLSMTERYYGGGNQISGALAEADVLGILGREGVVAATLWPLGNRFDCIFQAFAAYVNYDGQGSRFGDTTVGLALTDPARTAQVERVSAYASVDQGNPDRLVVVALNKSAAPLTAGLSVKHTRLFGRAELYRVTASTADPLQPGCTAPVRQPDTVLALRNAFLATLPPLSISVFVLRP
jgi:hypothetical protein